MYYVTVDIESKGTKPMRDARIWIVAGHTSKGNKIKLEFNPFGVTIFPEWLAEALEDEDACVIAHGLPFDIPYLLCNAKRKNNKPISIACQFWDTENMERIIVGQQLQSTKKDTPTEADIALYKQISAALNWVQMRYGFKPSDKSIRKNFINRPDGIIISQEEKDYGVSDILHLNKIRQAQEFILKRDGLWELALMENQVTEKLIYMKERGINFDSNRWRKIAGDNTLLFKQRSSALPSQVRNWNSTPQVKSYFQDHQGVKIDTYDDLDEIYLATKNKILAQFMYARELHKSVTSYGVSWFDEDYVTLSGKVEHGDGFIDRDGRIRAHVRQTINTGRMSMSEPNLQQLPGMGSKDPVHIKAMRLIRAQLGVPESQLPQHRSAFIPTSGNVFVIGDFSGQEIGIMAAASGEDLWINAMLRGDDVHGLTAMLLYEDEWHRTAEQGCKFPQKCNCKGHIPLRENAKILNFMLAYGGGPQKFARSTGLKFIDAKIIVKRYKQVIPKLTTYLETLGKTALDTGVSYSASPYKRRRVLSGEEPWHVENQGKNTPIQAAGADMLKLAMISVPNKYYMPLVIHDEIILDVKKNEADKAGKLLKSVMEQAADYCTGIKGLIKVKPKIQTNLMK